MPAAQSRHDVPIVLPQPSDDRVDEHCGVALPATRVRGRATHARPMFGQRTKKRASPLARRLLSMPHSL